MSKTFKKIIILLLILVLAGVIYFFFFSNKEKVNLNQNNSSLQSTNTGAPVTGIVQDRSISSIEADKIGQEFINQLLNLQAIKLNDEIFSSLSFQSLEDFTIILVQPGNEGRPNPFAPFGADNPNIDQSALPGVTETDISVIPVNDLPPPSQNLQDLNGS